MHRYHGKRQIDKGQTTGLQEAAWSTGKVLVNTVIREGLIAIWPLNVSKVDDIAVFQITYESLCFYAIPFTYRLWSGAYEGHT